MFRKTRNLARNRRGQSTIEYILILFIVVSVAMKFKGIYLKRSMPILHLLVTVVIFFLSQMILLWLTGWGARNRGLIPDLLLREARQLFIHEGAVHELEVTQIVEGAHDSLKFAADVLEFGPLPELAVEVLERLEKRSDSTRTH